jgi:hypothetical protein
MQTPATPSTPADPLAEAPGAVWYVRAPGGGQYGPAAADVMQSWLAEGRVSPDSLVWREGWRDWQQAAEVFPQLGAGRLDPELSAIAAGNAASATPGPGAHRRTSRSRSTAFNAAIITVLILAVIVLLVVFIWVLQGGPATDSGSSTEAAPASATAVERLPAY